MYPITKQFIVIFMEAPKSWQIKFNILVTTLAIVICSYVGQLFYQASMLERHTLLFNKLDNLTLITKHLVYRNETMNSEDEKKIIEILKDYKGISHSQVEEDLITDVNRLVQDLLYNQRYKDDTSKHDLERQIARKINTILRINHNAIAALYINQALILKKVIIAGGVLLSLLSLGALIYYRHTTEHTLERMNNISHHHSWESKTPTSNNMNQEQQDDLMNIVHKILADYESMLSKRAVVINIEEMHLESLHVKKPLQIRYIIASMLVAMISVTRTSSVINCRIGIKHGVIIISITNNELYLANKYHNMVFNEGMSDIESLHKLIKLKNQDGSLIDLEVPILHDLQDEVNLAKAQKLAAEYHGNIWVESSQEEGLSFWINLTNE